ncbi:MAG: polysaccharide biosynthesis/export family protein [Porphyromonadaceae bacterium]|nr:polysaccharide biosynthesis/export family protein [Porphyromonadaceae bacterium]
MQKTSDDVMQYPDTVSYKEYQLQKGDYLNIRVYSLNKEDVALYNCDNNVSGQNMGDDASLRLCLYLIDEQGYIYYPYIGKVAVEGKTIRQIKFELENMFKENIAKYVSIDVNLANRSFSVIGEGISKRIDMPHDKITVFQALAMVGDLPVYANRSKIKLIRPTDKGTVVKEFDLRSKSIINSEYYYIQPNDVLYIENSKNKYIGIYHISNAINVAVSTASLGIIAYKLIKTLKSSK